MHRCIVILCVCLGSITASARKPSPYPHHLQRFNHPLQPLKQETNHRRAAKAILKDKICCQDKRYPTFLKALELMNERKVRTLVETGTARSGVSGCEGDGCSTIVWDLWAALHQAHFYSVDSDAQALETASAGLQTQGSASTFVHADSVAFLHDFGRPIDFLYLDSYDFDPNDPDPSQQHHLNEIIAAYPWLHEKSIVMLDDCALPFGGKGKLAIAFLEEKGWKILQSGYQVILSNTIPEK